MFGGILRKGLYLAYRATTIGLSTGPKLTRYFMYQHLAQYSRLRAKELRVLSISHSERLGRLLGFTDEQITDVAYPDVNILDLPFADGEFDAVVSDQVLEHVEGNPQAAIDETFRVVKEDGLALHTTCLLYRIHGSPSDYWRFTPDALRYLVAKKGEVIDVGGWGNPYVLFLLVLGARITSVPHARWHPLHWLATKNAAQWPIQTWVLARKTAGDSRGALP
jgi:SAM-dependent methyltransferase